MIVYRKLSVVDDISKAVTERALAGDNDAVRTIRNFLSQYLMGVARNVTLKYSTTEELYQFLLDNITDKFFKYYVPERVSFMGWLSVVIPSQIQKFKRKYEKVDIISLDEPIEIEGEEVFLEDVLEAEEKQDLSYIYALSWNPQEKKVIDMILEGYSNKEIAEELDVVPSRVVFLKRQIGDRLKKYIRQYAI